MSLSTQIAIGIEPHQYPKYIEAAEINNKKFIFLQEDIRNTRFKIDFKGYTLIILGKITSVNDIYIEADDLFVFNDIISLSGKVHCVARKRFAAFGSDIISQKGNNIKARYDIVLHSMQPSIKAKMISQFRECFRDKSRRDIIADTIDKFITTIVEMSHYIQKSQKGLDPLSSPVDPKQSYRFLEIPVREPEDSDTDDDLPDLIDP